MTAWKRGGEKLPSHRTRFAAGVLLGVAVGVGVSAWLLGRARQEIASFGDVRRAVVSVRALKDLTAQATGSPAAPLSQIVAEWQKGHSEVASARIVLFDGLSLEASTDPADTGEKAAPRKLAREEKDLYDRGQRLRAAFETNREEKAARKDEIEVEEIGPGVFSVAGPIEKDGAVVGLVELKTVQHPPAPKPGLGLVAAWVAVPSILFLLVALGLGERRWPLAAVATVCVAAAFVLFGRTTLRTLDEDRRAVEKTVGAHVVAEKGRAEARLAAAGVAAAAPLDPASWDVDTFRQPRGLVSADGSPVQGKVDAEVSAAGGKAVRALALIGVVALALLAFAGLGGAAAFWRTLVENKQAYAYTAPAMVGMVVLVLFPFVYGVTLSFTDSNIYNSSKPIADIFVGLRNYVDILSDFKIASRAADGSLVFTYTNFYWTLFFTIVWTVSNVTIGVTVGLLLAVILNQKGLAFRPIYRVLLILPWAMPNYITALIWKGMFHQQFGVVNQIIQIFGGQPISWWDKPFTSFMTALATNGWLSFPFMMVISLGALQSIPADLYEAARVDGASRWQQFKSITLPSLKPALVPAVILSVVWTFNMFNIIFLVTQGEPGSSTEILITQAYKFAFEKYRYGFAAAYSTVIFGILVVYGTIQNKLSKGTEAV